MELSGREQGSSYVRVSLASLSWSSGVEGDGGKSASRCCRHWCHVVGVDIVVVAHGEKVDVVSAAIVQRRGQRWGGQG